MTEVAPIAGMRGGREKDVQTLAGEQCCSLGGLPVCRSGSIIVLNSFDTVKCEIAVSLLRITKKHTKKRQWNLRMG